MGTNPNSANILPLTVNATGIAFSRNPAATDVNFTVEATSNLTTNWTPIATKTGSAAWIPNPGVTVTDTGTGPVSVVESGSYSQRFWRVKVVRP